MRKLSLRWQVVLLVLASVLFTQAIGFGLLFLFPPPEPPRMTVMEVARLFRDPERSPATAELQLRPAAKPPMPADSGRLGRMIAGVLAAELGASPERVRVRLRGGSAVDPPVASPRVLEWGEVRMSVIVKRSRAGPAGAGAGPRLSGVGLLRGVPFPPFEAAVRRPDGGWMVVGPRERLLSPWRLRLLIAFGLSAALLLPLAWWSARRLTRPVRLFAEAAERLGLDPQAPPLAVEGPAEVRTAAASFNRMQERLRRYLEGRAAMFAAIAHDLRTPLTGLRLRAETAPPNERDRMAADIARMEAMIAQVLAFVRGEQVRETREPLDLAALAADCVREAAERGAAVRLGSMEPLPVEGEPLNLRRALSNLLENAATYGSTARVSAVRRDGGGVIAVEDEGPGLPPGELDRVFEPFARGEPSRSRATGGVGLGLATARGIVRAHGGEIVLRNRPEGGLAAELALPLRSDPGRPAQLE